MSRKNGYCKRHAKRPCIEGRFVHVSELSAKQFYRLCKAVLSLTDVINKGDSQWYALDFKDDVSYVWRTEEDSYGKHSSSKKRKIAVIPDINSKMALNVQRSSSKKCYQTS